MYSLCFEHCTLFNWSSYGGQNKDRTLLQHSQHCHKGEFRHVNFSARQQSLRCRHNLRRAFLRATLAMTAGSCAQAMAATGRQKGSLLHHQGEFLHNYYMFVSLHDSDHEGVVRIFVALSCELWGYLFTLITLDYTAQFFPYQECNVRSFLYVLPEEIPRKGVDDGVLTSYLQWLLPLLTMTAGISSPE